MNDPIRVYLPDQEDKPVGLGFGRCRIAQRYGAAGPFPRSGGGVVRGFRVFTYRPKAKCALILGAKRFRLLVYFKIMVQNPYKFLGARDMRHTVSV